MQSLPGKQQSPKNILNNLHNKPNLKALAFEKKQENLLPNWKTIQIWGPSQSERQNILHVINLRQIIA